MKTSILIGLSRHRIGVDGAGVTTLVAFHGCPLRCKYCLNPQALSSMCVWKRFSPEELFREICKDDLYFRATGGGLWRWRVSPILQGNSSVQKTLLRKWQALEDKHRDFAECTRSLCGCDGGSH